MVGNGMYHYTPILPYPLYLYLVKKKTGDPEIPGVQIRTPSVFFFTRARARIQVYGIWVRGPDPGSWAPHRSSSPPHPTSPPHA
jgi:hypothetical protein